MEKKNGRKPKFKPTITRIKLNPEQAVLACSCYDSGGLIQLNVVGYPDGEYVESGFGGSAFNACIQGGGRTFQLMHYGSSQTVRNWKTFSLAGSS